MESKKPGDVFIINGLFSDQRGTVRKGKCTGHNDEGVPCHLYTWITHEEPSLVAEQFVAFNDQIEKAIQKNMTSSDISKISLNLYMAAQDLADNDPVRADLFMEAHNALSEAHSIITLLSALVSSEQLIGKNEQNSSLIRLIIDKLDLWKDTYE